MILPSVKNHLSDYIGIVSAVLCLIHCLAGPVIMSTGLALHTHTHTFGGVAHTHPESFWLHRGWDFVFLGIGLIAVVFSTRHTPNPRIKFLLWVTFGFLAAGILFEAQAVLFQYLVYIASLALVLAHYANIKQLVKSIRKPKQAPEAVERVTKASLSKSCC